jgi:hypothetical protein
MTGKLILIVLQLSVCVLSFFCLAVLGPWAREDPWPIIFPMVIGSVWVYITVHLIRGAHRKTLLLLLAAVELPFAFGWPAWAMAYFVLPYGNR